jgi:hypothetical protein
MVEIVQEELPVADHLLPHEHEWHGRLERAKVRVVDRRPRIALVERAEHDPVFEVGGGRELLDDIAEDAHK